MFKCKCGLQYHLSISSTHNEVILLPVARKNSRTSDDKEKTKTTSQLFSGAKEIFIGLQIADNTTDCLGLPKLMPLKTMADELNSNTPDKRGQRMKIVRIWKEIRNSEIYNRYSMTLWAKKIGYSVATLKAWEDRFNKEAKREK